MPITLLLASWLASYVLQAGLLVWHFSRRDLPPDHRRQLALWLYILAGFPSAFAFAVLGLIFLKGRGIADLLQVYASRMDLWRFWLDHSGCFMCSALPTLLAQLIGLAVCFRPFDEPHFFVARLLGLGICWQPIHLLALTLRTA